jgi:hypothetical protein
MGVKLSLPLRAEQKLKVFEKRVLMRICGPKREKVAGGLRRLRNEELHNLYSLPNLIRVIKSRSMRLVDYVARKGEMRCIIYFGWKI